MADRGIMDPTKQPCGAITMAYQDHFFLERWVRHYAAQFGRQHLYILSHGGDPEHARIGEGCNIITLPRDPTMFRLDRRRWAFISQFANGMLRYYNWLFVGDVDEVVIVDPDVAADLPTYLRRYDVQGAPKSLCPLGLELIHNPAQEPEPIANDAPILSRRRNFRVNANYSKPCVMRREAAFTIGGHANNHLPRVLDPHMYLIHMRFFDYDITCARLAGRREMREIMTGDRDPASVGHAWGRDLENFKALASGVPVREDAELAEVRAKMLGEQQLLHDGKVAFFGGGRTKEFYRLPDRFAGVF
ncbi:MAG: glycosyltransferase family 2 protein [Cypionkella sp.]|nr:glycosyltransferase family 2 protein [Cypionkella sp.]